MLQTIMKALFGGNAAPAVKTEDSESSKDKKETVAGTTDNTGTTQTDAKADAKADKAPSNDVVGQTSKTVEFQKKKRLTVDQRTARDGQKFIDESNARLERSTRSRGKVG